MLSTAMISLAVAVEKGEIKWALRVRIEDSDDPLQNLANSDLAPQCSGIFARIPVTYSKQYYIAMSIARRQAKSFNSLTLKLN